MMCETLSILVILLFRLLVNTVLYKLFIYSPLLYICDTIYDYS